MTSLKGSGVSFLRLSLTDWSDSSTEIAGASFSASKLDRLVSGGAAFTLVSTVCVCVLHVRAPVFTSDSGGLAKKSSLSMRLFLHLPVVSDTYLI